VQSETNYFRSRGSASEFYCLAGKETDCTGWGVVVTVISQSW